MLAYRTNPAEQRVEDARKMFARVLRDWASDALRLRRSGMDRPAQRQLRGLGAWRAPVRDSALSEQAA